MSKKVHISKTEMDYLADFVSELNKKIIKDFGGAEGRINEGNLVYSLWNALKQAKKEGRREDFHKVWAAYTLYEISRKHPFTDGNKRTSYVTSKLILRLGKLDFEVNYEDAVHYLKKIAGNKVPYEEVYLWIEKHSKEVFEEPSEEVKSFIKMLSMVTLKK